VGKSRAHDVKLVFDAPPAVPEPRHVELRLELAAAEDRVALGIKGFVEFAGTRYASAELVAGITCQLAENEAFESGVIRRGFEAEGANCSPQSHFKRISDFGLEIRVAFVEGHGCIVRSS